MSRSVPHLPRSSALFTYTSLRGYTKGEKVAERIAGEVLQDNQSNPGRSSDPTHNQPKDSHRCLGQFEKTPEKEQKRKFHGPQRRPEQKVEGELQLEEERSAIHEVLGHRLGPVVKVLDHVHWRDGDLVDNGCSKVEGHGKEDEMVVNEEPLVFTVLDMGADGDEEG